MQAKNDSEWIRSEEDAGRIVQEEFPERHEARCQGSTNASTRQQSKFQFPVSPSSGRNSVVGAELGITSAMPTFRY